MNRLEGHFDKSPIPRVQSSSENNSSFFNFDDEFVDITDYIHRTTARIWEGKQVGLIYDYYADYCPVYTMTGVSMRAEDVVQSTLSTLASFPDRTLEAINVVSGKEPLGGLHTSHLIRSHMTNLADSVYGPATGKNATILVIAHCIVKDNKVTKEWLVRDNYGLVVQLGHDPLHVAQTWARYARSESFIKWRSSEIERVTQSVNKQRASYTDDPKTFIRSFLQNIWNARMVGDVHLFYSPDAIFHGVAGRNFAGPNEIAGFYMKLLGTVSELKFSLDYVCDTDLDGEASLVAVRWTLCGIHSGPALYGEPTNSQVFFIGESQYRLLNGKVVEEWTVFDELSVLADIFRSRLTSTRNSEQNLSSENND